MDDKKIIAIEDYLSKISREALKSATGTYTGDGKSSRTLEIGFSPKFIIIQRFLDTGKETPASFTPSNSLIWDKTVTGSAVTSVTTNGTVTLDGSTHGGYDFEFVIVNAVAGVQYPRLYINNDTTTTNYNYVAMFQAYGGAAPARIYANDAAIVEVSGTGSTGIAVSKGTISQTVDGYIVTSHTEARLDGVIYTWMQNKIATVTNLTRIDIVHPGGAYLGVNSRFRLWRKIMPVNPVVTNNMLFATADNPGVSFVPSLGYILNGVTGFSNTGVTLGNSSDVNQETKTYTYFALG